MAETNVAPRFAVVDFDVINESYIVKVRTSATKR